MGATAVPETWIVGASGLLGSACRRAVERRGGTVLTARIPWQYPDDAVAALLTYAERLPEDGWRVLWCAGSGVVATSPEHFDQELGVLSAFLERWNPVRGTDQSVFLASSAGGVYAGSVGPPFTEHSDPNPLSPYGHAKLRAESAVSSFAERTGVPVLLGRLSNLYGPGQDLTKGQGLISLLCRAHLTGDPLDVYVSLDTIRDYVFADDAAAMVLSGADAVAGAGGVHTKILAHGQAMTISAVLGEMRRLTRRRPPIITRPLPVSRYQATDLRMRSVVWPPLQAHARTSFGVGMAACMAAVEASLRCPQDRQKEVRL